MTRARQRWALLSLVLCGCAPALSPPPQAFRFEARPTRGEIRVLPPLDLHDAAAVDTRSWVGAGLPWVREVIRMGRTEQVEALPAALGLAVPGAVNAALGQRWAGQFRSGRFPLGAQGRLRRALQRSDAELDLALGEVAQASGGTASLFVWVRALQGDPISAEGFPGDVVETRMGPVLVDQLDEPYRVRATLGVALVAADGEVLVRYVDDYESLLMGRAGTTEVARDLARDVANEVSRVWATDPRLWRAEPGAPEIALR